MSRPIMTSAAAIIGLALFLTSCGKKEQTQQEEQQQETAVAYQPTGDEATITGVVHFAGEAPPRRKIQMDADPVCAQKNPNALAEDVVVTNGKLRNVFIHIKSGAEKWSFPTPQQEVVIDQVGCIYVPHVLGLQRNQPLKIISSDNTNHNIHPAPKNNPEWNVSQPPGAPPIVKTFAREEVMIPVKCNQHPWMRAYIGVLRHPFFAVSKEDGTFEIKGLPPGEYEIEAWHEKYGAQTSKVTLTAKETKTIEFTYQPTQAYRPGSLKMMPALVLPCCGEELKHEDY